MAEIVQTLAPNIDAVYTLTGSGPDGFLTISVTDTRTGQVYGAATGNFSDRDSMDRTIRDQLFRAETRARQAQLAKERQVNQLVATINSGTLDPESKAAAERELVQERAILAELTSTTTSLRNASNQFFFSFSAVMARLEQSVTPPPTNVATVNPAPVVPAAPAETVVTNPVPGSGDDDSGAPQASAPGTTPNSPAGPAGAGGTTPSTASGSETAPPAGRPSSVTLPTIANYTFSDFSKASTQEVDRISTPGRRLKNPLGEFNSYTYQLSLYVITPDAYAAFIASGRKKIDIFNSVAEGKEGGGAWLVAQSGGINNTNSKRAPGFEYDYGIDNLQIKSFITGNSNGGTANVSDYDYSFDIYEPYGFSFVTNLRRINDVIAEYSGGQASTPENPSKQFFILGIKFLGYGSAGTPAKPSDVMSYNGAETEPNYVTGAIDPLSRNGNLFEYYKEIQITSIKMKLDGKMTVYQMEAKNAGSQGGFSMKRGLVNFATSITAGNVAQAIDDLMVKLNDVQQQRLVSGRIGAVNKYKVVWAPGTQQIIDATLISDADLQKFKWPGSGAITQEQVNAALEVRTSSASNTSIKIEIKEQTPILQVINQIITQSSFLENALKTVYTTSLQAPENQNAPAQVENAQQTRVSWYSCSAIIEKMVWDSNVDDWAYDIVYYIQSYQTPVVDSVYIKPGKYYPGPHKRYDYWYTGKNSEIIKYEQVFNNLFINVALDPRPSDIVPAPGQPAGSPTPASASNPGTRTDPPPATSTESAPITPGVSQVLGQQSNQIRLGRTGLGMEAQNNYLTSLYDPAKLASFTMEILGDPDYLFEEPSFSENVIYSSIYGSGSNSFNINPTGGQVFIEIDFKEAVDYTSQTGTLSINDSIQFWKYPEGISSKIKGISYMLFKVDSKFSGGSFTQQLSGQINTFSNADPPADREGPAEEGTGASTTTPANDSNQTSATPVTLTGPNGQPVANSDGSPNG
jgi:hypothetical protein